MKNNNVKGIIALALVTVLSFGVILGSKALTKDSAANESANAADEKVLEELDTNGAEGIEKAVKTENGYMVTVRTKGYGGDILMNVSFDETATNVTKVEVTEQSETEGVGSLITEAEFLSQFEGVAAPVYLPGMTLETEAPAEEAATEEAATEEVVLNDGTYEAKTTEADQNGFTETFTMTVEGGKIVSAAWDCVDAEGNLKSVLSETGAYVMTEDGPTWKEQAAALAAALVENQNVAALGMNDEGKTDAVSGVSINIMGFVGLAEDCIAQAAGAKEVAVAALNDGTYEAKTAEADKNGFIEVVTMTVADGKITEVVWDCIDADGNKKSVLSETGAYVMTEDGPTWKEQAEALGAAVVANQNTEALGMNEEGKTDAVSGVSIYIGGFVSLVEDCMTQAAATQTVALVDGTYEAKTAEADKSGYIGEVTLVVEGGKIASVVWDCVDADGNKKSVQSENGEYVMTEDGPTWKEQAEALAAALVASQDIAALGMNEEGKTDAVSGVSINIMGFVSLVEECLADAAGEAAADEVAEEVVEETVEEAAPMNGTQVDGVSGATISSTAAVKGINAAYTFLQSVK